MFQSFTPVTLLPCYPVTLLPCYLVTLLPCYPVTLLPCYPVTLLPCYLLPCYHVTLSLKPIKKEQHQPRQVFGQVLPQGFQGLSNLVFNCLDRDFQLLSNLAIG